MDICRKVKSCYLADMYVVGANANRYDKSEFDKNRSTSTTVFQAAHFSLLAGTRATLLQLSRMAAKRHRRNPVRLSLQEHRRGLALSLQRVFTCDTLELTILTSNREGFTWVYLHQDYLQRTKKGPLDIIQ